MAKDDIVTKTKRKDGTFWENRYQKMEPRRGERGAATLHHRGPPLALTSMVKKAVAKLKAKPKEEVMPKKKKAKKKAPRRVASPEAKKVAADKRYVTGPRGGMATAERVDERPPKTKGPKLAIFGKLGGRKAEASTKPGKAGEPVKPRGKKSDAQKGVEAILERRNQGTRAGSRTLGRQKAAQERDKAKKKGQKKQK